MVEGQVSISVAAPSNALLAKVSCQQALRYSHSKRCLQRRTRQITSFDHLWQNYLCLAFPSVMNASKASKKKSSDAGVFFRHGKTLSQLWCLALLDHASPRVASHLGYTHIHRTGPTAILPTSFPSVRGAALPRHIGAIGQTRTVPPQPSASLGRLWAPPAG